MKKLISLLLLLALMMSIMPTSLAQEAPTVVTLALWHSVDMDNGKWYQANELKLLKEKYNIDLQYQYYDTDQFSLLMAGGKLPDIVTCSDSYITTVLDNNMALNLDPLIEKYAPNMALDIYTSSHELSRTLMGGADKQLYFLFPGVGPEDLNSNDSDSWGIRLRWDLYKQLGCPEINTADDYIKVMKDMIALYPETASGEKVYGTGTWDVFSRWYQTGCLLVDGGALNPWVFGGTMYMSGWDDTVLYNGYTNFDRSAYWTAMSFFHKCYTEGLLDPDSFIMTRDELTAKYAAGRYVAAVPYEGTALYKETVKEDPNTLIGIMNIGSPAAFVFADKLALTGNAPSDNIFVNAKSENWEAALKVLDFFHDPETIRTTFCGIKGVDWDVDANGVPALTERALNNIKTLKSGTDEYIAETGIIGQLTEWTLFCGTGVAPDGYPYDLGRTYEVRAQVLTPLQKDFADYHDVICPSKYYMSLVDEGKTISVVGDYGQMIAAGISEIPMDIKRIMDQCSDIAYRAIPELVMAESDAEYEEIKARLLKEWADAGEATAWAWAEENFNAVKAEMQPIFEAARTSFLATKKE